MLMAKACLYSLHDIKCKIHVSERKSWAEVVTFLPHKHAHLSFLFKDIYYERLQKMSREKNKKPPALTGSH